MMHRNKCIHFANKGTLLLAMLICIVSQAPADEALGSSIDCSEVSVNYTENSEWTHSEQLEAMDKAFFESVNRFELCNLSNQSSASSSSENNSDGGTGTEASLDSESEADLYSSVSSEMSGTETESTLPPIEPPESSELSESATEESVTVNGGGVSNGSIPEDIPAADNDDVIATQIRLAAEIETDPVKKEKLWNEYRKYKGLPVNEQ